MYKLTLLTLALLSLQAGAQYENDDDLEDGSYDDYEEDEIKADP